MTTTDTGPRPDTDTDGDAPATTRVRGAVVAQWIGVLAVLLVGLALIFGTLHQSAAPAGHAAPAVGSSAPLPAASGAPPSAPAGPLVLATSVPTAVSVPSIGAASSLIQTGLRPDGSIDVPPVADPMQASWYDRSPTPGAPGPAVILGHINGDGHPGVFNQLARVKQGDQILVDRADHRRAVFTVSHVDTVSKGAFPTAAVYSDTPNPQLRLISCGGDYDAAHHNYLSNIIVYADLTGVAPM